MTEKMKKVGRALENLSVTVLLLLSIVIFGGLTYYSVFYTEELKPDSEVPLTVRDSVGGNFLFVFVIMILFFVIYKIWNARAEKGLPQQKTQIPIIAATAAVAAISIAWVSICHVMPRGDGDILCTVARLAIEGNYDTMGPPGYMFYNPHQFGLVTVMQVLFRLFGKDNHIAFQYMNALCMPLLFYSGFRLTEIICERRETLIYYSILFFGFLPLFLYVPYVYGETASITFTAVLMWQVVSYCKSGSKTCFLWGTLSAVIACIMRINSLIVVLAAGIVLVVYGVREAKPQPFVWLLALVLALNVSDAGIRIYYERESGREMSDGTPYISYVLMGLEDGPDGPGWFNGRTYYETLKHEYDSEATAADNKIDVKNRLRELWDNKAYGVGFFRRKVLSQWNSPAYNSLYETCSFDCGREELPEIVRWVYYDNEALVRAYMNRYQALFYFSAAVMAVTAFVKRKREWRLENYILVIAVIGGLLFSIIWEAKSRYALPYVAYMIPLAAIGICRIQDGMNLLYSRMKRGAERHEKGTWIG